MTTRELDVLKRIAAGMTNAEIALDLGIGEETVKTHVRKLLRALDARGRAHAVAIGFREGELR